jgi:hypothetical protein
VSNLSEWAEKLKWDPYAMLPISREPVQCLTRGCKENAVDILDYDEGAPVTGCCPKHYLQHLSDPTSEEYKERVACQKAFLGQYNDKVQGNLKQRHEALKASHAAVYAGVGQQPRDCQPVDRLDIPALNQDKLRGIWAENSLIPGTEEYKEYKDREYRAQSSSSGPGNSVVGRASRTATEASSSTTGGVRLISRDGAATFAKGGRPKHVPEHSGADLDQLRLNKKKKLFLVKMITSKRTLVVARSGLSRMVARRAPDCPSQRANKQVGRFSMKESERCQS